VPQLKTIRKLIWPLGFLSLWMGISFLLANRQFVINTSPSVAPGIYLRVADRPGVGRIVDFPIPPVARAYVHERTGYWGNNWYILKPIAAGPGDRVNTLGRWLYINGHQIAPIYIHDEKGRLLPHWRADCVLGQGEYFVYSSRIWNSFDSRYYGPISQSQITAVRVPLIRW
jgi:conjugative transfer signal peptidase TraF